MKLLKLSGMLVCFAAAFAVVLYPYPKDTFFSKQPLLPLVLFFGFTFLGACLVVKFLRSDKADADAVRPVVAVPVQVPPVSPVKAAARSIPAPPTVAPAGSVATAFPVDKLDEVGVASQVAPEVQELRRALEVRVQEAADFKKAIENEALRAGQNRSDLKEVNEAIAGLLQSVEFFKQRLAAEKDTLDNLLPQVEEAIDDVLERAKLVKGLPAVGQRLADQPVDSCTIFNRLPAPTPEQKGQIVEVRNSWVGFRVDQRLIIVSPSRIAVYN
jgi:hypothetical protein